MFVVSVAFDTAVAKFSVVAADVVAMLLLLVFLVLLLFCGGVGNTVLLLQLLSCGI